MASIFGINIVGSKRVSALLRKARAGVKGIFATPETSPDHIPKKVLKMQQERFEKSGNVRAQKDPDRNRWKSPLSKKTTRRKNQDRGKLLTDTGKLRNSIIIARDTFNSMLVKDTGYAVIGVRRVQNRQVSAGSSTDRIGGATKGTRFNVRYTDEYGLYNQEGTAHTPKRAFLGVGDLDAKEIEDSMKSQFDRFVGRFV